MDTNLIMYISVKYYLSLAKVKYRCAHKLLGTSFLISNFHGPSYRKTKPSYMIKYFQIDVEKRFVNFHCCAKSFRKAFTVLIFS